MIDTLIEKIKGKGTRIVFTEGSDARILELLFVYIRKHPGACTVRKPC